MSVRDMRNAGWCWQEKATLRVLRCHYDGERLKQRSTALAVYLALTEAASNTYNNSGVFEVVHMALADMTGTSRTTIKRYLSEFEKLGVIAVERRKNDEGTSKPNIYVLLGPPSTDGPYPSTQTEGVQPTNGPYPSTDGPLLEEPTLKKDLEETDQQFALRNGKQRGYGKAQALAIAAQHTRDGVLNRGAFLDAIPRR